MSNNFSFLANYTWSKCLAIADNPGDVAAPAMEHSLNPRLDRGPCGFDVRHIFNTTLVASSHFSSLTGWKGAIVNNWQAAPLIRILSGAVLNVTSGVDNSRTGLNLDRPDQISGAVYTGNKIQRTGANLAYISKTAFAQNAVGTYGNLSRNAFVNPATTTSTFRSAVPSRPRTIEVPTPHGSLQHVQPPELQRLYHGVQLRNLRQRHWRRRPRISNTCRLLRRRRRIALQCGAAGPFMDGHLRRTQAAQDGQEILSESVVQSSRDDWLIAIAVSLDRAVSNTTPRQIPSTFPSQSAALRRHRVRSRSIHSVPVRG